MELHITSNALKKLSEIAIPENHGLRIDTELYGGWSCSIRYILALDEPRKNDYINNFGKLMIYIDQIALHYLGDELKLDYAPNRGFKLVTPEEILAYGLNIKMR